MDCSNKNSAWNSQPTKRSLNLRTMAVEKTTTSRLKHTGVTKKTREYQTTQKKHTPTKRRVFLLEAVKVDGFWSNVFFKNISWIFKDFCCRSFFHAFHNVWPCFLIGLFEPSLPRNSYIIIYIYIYFNTYMNLYASSMMNYITILGWSINSPTLTPKKHQYLFNGYKLYGDTAYERTPPPK